MHKFKVGDICILQHATIFPEMNGVEVMVTRPLLPVDLKYPDGSIKEHMCYTVDATLPDGSICCPEQHQLRRKNRDDEDWAQLKIAHVIADAIISM